MHQDHADQTAIFCEKDPRRRERMASAFSQSGYPGRLVFVSSLSEAIANTAHEGATVVFFCQDRGRNISGCAREFRAGLPASILIMIIPGASDQELLEAIRNGADEAVLEDDDSIRGFPLVAARAAARRNSLFSELKLVRDQLRQQARPASIGMLVSGVAHDINNALTGTLAYAELLELAIFDEAAKQDLRKIVDSAGRCKKMLENLLSFARDLSPVKSLESVNDLIERTIDLCAYRLRSQGTSVVRDYDQLPAVFVDGQRLQQAILNLLLYAKQAVPGPGRTPGTITFSTRYRKNDRLLIVRISNKGPGIPEKHAKSGTEGGQLGLSEAYSIIREHGGAISAQNDPDGGTIFIIELPTGADSAV